MKGFLSPSDRCLKVKHSKRLHFSGFNEAGKPPESLHSLEFLLDMHILLHLQGQLTPSVKCRGFKCEACHSWGEFDWTRLWLCNENFMRCGSGAKWWKRGWGEGVAQRRVPAKLLNNRRGEKRFWAIMLACILAASKNNFNECSWLGLYSQCNFSRLRDIWAAL